MTGLSRWDGYAEVLFVVFATLRAIGSALEHDWTLTLYAGGAAFWCVSWYRAARRADAYEFALDLALALQRKSR